MVHLSTSFCAACLLGTISLPVWLASSYPSAVGADFGPLEKLLKAEQWEAAAEATQDVVFQISQKNHHPTIGQDMLTAQSVENFPCKDIKSLDSLWRKYSHNRFGYRSQLLAANRQSIALNYEKLRESPQVWSQFTSQMGWQAWQARTEESSEVKQSTDVPEGNFPLPVRSTGDFGDAAVVRGEGVVFGMSFLARSKQCGVE
jgi:GUN4-like